MAKSAKVEVTQKKQIRKKSEPKKIKEDVKLETSQESPELNMDPEALKKRKNLLNRVKTVRGHLLGVEKMIEDGKPCDEVLIQIAAIKSSVHRIGAIILNEHAIDCIINQNMSEDENKEKLEKMLKTLINFSG